MKTYQLNKTVGVVEVDQTAAYFHVNGNKLEYIVHRKGSIPLATHETIPEGNWQFLSLASDMTEEKARLIIPNNGFKFLSCIPTDMNCYSSSSALESFNSWLKANSIKGNTVILIKDK